MFHNRRQLISAARRPFVAAAGGPYQGPGDITTFSAWWGLRGYTAAFTGPVIDIYDSVGANPATINLNTSTHLLDMATLALWSGPPGNHGTAYVSKVYDQTGGTNHLSPSNAAQAPSIAVGATGLKSGYPSIVFNAAGNTTLIKSSGLFSTVSQPFTMSCFVWSNAGSTTNGLLGDLGTFTGLFIGNGTAGIYANAVLSTSISGDTWYALHGLANNTNSYVYLDSAITGPGAAGTFPISNANNFAWGRAYDNFNGKSTEAGVIGSDQRSSFLAIAAQQRAFWLP